MDTHAVRDWWRSLPSSPAPLSRRERAGLLLATLAIAATRPLALSRTLWDWDEALFALAIRDYDVTAYHPHPPGFPLFVGLAKLLPMEPFDALQALVLTASLFLFPSAFVLARELRASLPTAFASAVVLAFLPNVWFYGGTAFSDVPALLLALLAAALLLRGCRSDAALLAGAVLAGAGAAIRPQNALLAAVPMLLAFSHRRRTAVFGSIIATVIAGAAFAVAAQASGGWEPYRETLARHALYIRERDSFLGAIRPSLLQVADDFFYRPFRAPLVNAVLALLAGWSVLRMPRRPHLLAAAAIFGPFVLFAWLYLDFHSVSRFSLAYMPLVALLAADALPRRLRTTGGALLALAMALWAWPAIRTVRGSASPPAAAANLIRTLDRERTAVYVDPALAPHAELLLAGYQRRIAGRVAPAVAMGDAVLMVEGSRRAPGTVGFVRERLRLEGIARRRYFETSVVPVERIAFGPGWYGVEGEAGATFRWMSARGVVHLPRRSAPFELAIRFFVPRDGPVGLWLDGLPLARIEARRGVVERTFRIESGGQLTLEAGAVERAAGDPRELGLRIDFLEVR